MAALISAIPYLPCPLSWHYVGNLTAHSRHPPALGYMGLGDGKADPLRLLRPRWVLAAFALIGCLHLYQGAGTFFVGWRAVLRAVMRGLPRPRTPACWRVVCSASGCRPRPRASPCGMRGAPLSRGVTAIPLTPIEAVGVDRGGPSGREVRCRAPGHRSFGIVF